MRTKRFEENENPIEYCSFEKKRGNHVCDGNEKSEK